MNELYNIGETVKCYKILDYVYENNNMKYKCECTKCGNIVIVYGSTIKSSKGLGCRKCFTNSYIHTELIGKKFGCYTVIGVGSKKAYRNEQTYICRCDCGNEIIQTKAEITQQPHICCIKCRPKYLETHNGCYKHGGSKRSKRTQLYDVWCNMRARCYDENNNRYYIYGKKGIKVCDEWLGEHGFENFKEWAINNGYVEERSKSGRNKLTIDRIDINKDYCPENCRWADNFIQANNTSRNRYVEYNGETHTWKEWSRILNVPYYRIQSRLKKGMSFEDAIKNVNYHDKRSLKV